MPDHKLVGELALDVATALNNAVILPWLKLSTKNFVLVVLVAGYAIAKNSLFIASGIVIVLDADAIIATAVPFCIAVTMSEVDIAPACLKW